MDVVHTRVLFDFINRHADARSPVQAWLAEAQEAEWRCPQDIKERYASASFLANNRVIFNIKGNHYRLDTKVAYNSQKVFIVRIGTHAEYTKWEF